MATLARSPDAYLLGPYEWDSLQNGDNFNSNGTRGNKSEARNPKSETNPNNRMIETANNHLG
jgi:hypothetical protein